MKQYSGLQVLAFVVLLLSTGLAIVSLATNYWSYYSYQLGESSIPISFRFEGGRRGLWQQCYSKGAAQPLIAMATGDSSTEFCANRFDRLPNVANLEELKDVFKEYDVWEIICLALMGGSALLGVLTLIVSPCICTRCGCCLSIFVLVAGLSAASGVCAYCYLHLTGKFGATPRDGITGISISPDAFGYSFWCAVGASIGQLLASVLFAVGRDRGHQYSQTI